MNEIDPEFGNRKPRGFLDGNFRVARDQPHSRMTFPNVGKHKWTVRAVIAAAKILHTYAVSLDLRTEKWLRCRQALRLASSPWLQH